MANYKKISKKAQELDNKIQLDLLNQYFTEYNLMNHYQNWLNSRLAKKRLPRGLDWKMFFNPLFKLFRKR